MKLQVLTDDDLREDQCFIAGTMLTEPAKLIVAPMGRGKTGASLRAARTLLDTFTVRRILIVGPLRVAKDTWPDEIRRWAFAMGLDFSVAVGTEAVRKAAVDAQTEITIINRENLPWLAKYIGSVDLWPYDCVIIDESSAFKAGVKRTKRKKAKNAAGKTRIVKGGRITRFGVLTAARRMIDRIYLLTGTPAPNGLMDLWAQIYLLDQGKRLEPTPEAFKSRWFNTDKYTFAVTPKDGAEKEIMDRIADVMVSLPPLKLVPDPVYIPVMVDLSDTDYAEYKKFKRTLVSQAHDVEAVNAGVLTNKLLQFANGSMYKEDRSVTPVHAVKLDALDELIERAGEESVLIFYAFQFDLDAIRARHPDAVVLNEDDDAIQKWNRGEIKKLLAHPASCAHGLNMQYGGHIAIWFGLTWSLEFWLQANARLPRPGQTEIVAVYMIMARNTDDERVLDVLTDKDATQDRISRAVRRAVLGEDAAPEPAPALPFVDTRTEDDLLG